ncbi:CoA transferase [Nocardia sp. R6R-6]|uniref:CoA transferase n=1 Tax=Nocardia sp. R6R-6 TaxID=3459303 RepID=UPI00403DE85E
MTSPRISRLRAVDLGSGLPAAIVAKVLGELGVRVTRVMWPGDSLAAQAPALRTSTAPWTACGSADVESVLAESDICVCGPSGEAAARGLTAEMLRDRFPKLVVLDIVAEEVHDGPEVPAAELLVQARNGMCFEQFGDRPTQLAFSPGTFGAAFSGLLGLWAALLERTATGQGCLVRTSLQRGMTLMWPHLLLTTQRPDPVFDRVPPKDVRHLIFRCADGGFVQIVLGAPGALAALYRLLGVPIEVDPGDPGAPDPSRGPGNFFADRMLLEPFFAAIPQREILDRLGAAGLPAAPVLEPGACFDDEQVAATGYLREDGSGRRFVGNVLELKALDTGRPAPTRNRGPGEGPLRGIRVVDIGNFVAGPFASRLLSDLGADVIQVEPPTGIANLTGARNVWVCTRGKRSVRIDLKAAEGRAVLGDLLSDADVFLHNFRPGAAERLGLDAATLRTDYPDLVHLHTTAFGETGPQAGQPGFDMVMQALAGHEVRAGGVGNDPLWYRSPFIDYGTGALGAVAILVALYERAAGGGAAEVKNSLLGTALFFAAGVVRDPDGTVTGAPLLAADRTGFHPAESLYRTLDGWIAVWAPDAPEARALAEALNLTDLGPREAWDQSSRERIAGRFRSMNTAEALASLERHRVPAVRCERDPVVRLSGMRAAWDAGLVAETYDPRYGRVWGCFGPPVLFEDRPPRRDGFTPAPVSGSDTCGVLSELGYDRARIDELAADGVCHVVDPRVESSSPEPTVIR